MTEGNSYILVAPRCFSAFLYQDVRSRKAEKALSAASISNIYKISPVPFIVVIGGHDDVCSEYQRHTPLVTCLNSWACQQSFFPLLTVPCDDASSVVKRLDIEL